MVISSKPHNHTAGGFRFRRCIIETLRVSGSSRPNSVAGAIAALLRSESEVEVQAIGPQAVNQAVKAIAIARSYIEGDGLDLSTQPAFVKLELQNEERTAVRFTVRSLPLEPGHKSQYYSDEDEENEDDY